MPVMPQKLAGWRIEPPVSVPVAAGSRRAATAAAEPPEEPPGTRDRVPGVAHRPEGRVLVARAHRELVAVELAERHRAGLGEPGDDGGVERAAVAGQHARAGGRRQVAGDEDVLVGDRHADQRAGARRRRAARRPRAAWASARLGSTASAGARGARGAARRSSRCCVASTLDSSPRPQRPAERRDAQLVQRVASLIRSPCGTRNRPSSTAGALCWLAARSSASVTTSSRRRRCASLDRRQRRVQRLDAARVDRAHLLDDAKEAVELLEHRACFGGAEIEARQLGDAAHVGGGQGHGARRERSRQAARVCETMPRERRSSGRHRVIIPG